jgi:hypothetical protein
MTKAIISTAMFLVCAVSLGQDVVPPQHWPPLKPGIWQVHRTREFPNGKTKSVDFSDDLCTDPIQTFTDVYWGFGKVAELGCSFDTAKISDSRYKIGYSCLLIGGAVSKSEAVVTLKGDAEYEMYVTTKEYKREYKAEQAGKWVKSCDK